MRKLMAISVASTLLGYAAVHFAFFAKPKPAPEAEQPVAVAVPAEPVVLAQVVDVTDLDPLLDPPPARAAGVPFDAAEPLEPVSAVPGGAPAPIPPADDIERPTAPEVAPLPHEVSARPALDSGRVSWYGDRVFHRQLYDWLNGLRPGEAMGIGFFF